MSVITRVLPKRFISRCVGHLMHFQGPSWWAQCTIKAFASFYKINILEAEKPLNQYPSIGEFFIRRLKQGTRPLANTWAVHPADSKITQAAAIEKGQLIQAKGSTYSLSEFTQDPQWEKKWLGGCFITYYLCPTDYHRVHSPVDGVITSVRHMPGQLWPVNQWSTTHIKNLFAINERILVEIETDLGAVAVVFVGATNVGHICLSFDRQIRGNQSGSQVMNHKIYSPPITVKKGDELGLFRMGSTVVMVYPQNFYLKFQDQKRFSEWIGNSVKVLGPLI